MTMEDRMRVALAGAIRDDRDLFVCRNWEFVWWQMVFGSDAGDVGRRR